MVVKKAGNQIFGVSLTKAERKALDIELNRQIAAADRRYTNDLDAAILYTLHHSFGFGPARLRKFYDAVHTEREQMIKHYEMPDDYTWLCISKLKEIGVDVEAWNAAKRSMVE